MDSGRQSRRWPGHTDKELAEAILRQTNPERRAAMEAELSARRAGLSKPFVTPQVAGGTPIIGRFKS